MEFKFNEQQLANQAKYRKFAEEVVKPLEEEMDENTKGMLEAYNTPIDFTDKNNIKPIIEAINSLSK